MAHESPHSRIDLACQQLDVAIELFFAKRSFVSALTLAGAAEEILGVELRNRGQQNTMARRYAERQRLYERIRKNRRFYPSVILAPQGWVEFAARENYARNAAKHITDRKTGHKTYDAFFRADPQTASVSMILRAMHNQELLHLPRSELGHKFYGWHLSTIYSDEPDEE